MRLFYSERVFSRAVRTYQRPRSCVSAPPSIKALYLIGILAVPLQAPATSNAAVRQASGIWLEAREQTACEAMQDDYCPGRYGFTIKHDGRFIAGPSDQGAKTEGQINGRELQHIQELAERLSSSLRSGRRTCERGGLAGIKDHLDLELAAGFVVRMYDLGNGQICYLGQKGIAQQLHRYVRSLMLKYYPIPFSKR
jgi:hypothetical protein